MGTWLAIVLVLATAVVLSFRLLARRSFKRGRELQSLSDMHAAVKDRVSSEVFNEVWSKVGEAFSIDPRALRPTDTLKSLHGIDSWDLGKGGDALNQWLAQKQLGKPPHLETVLDLAIWVQDAKAATEAH
jgi:hypothetical protein